MPSQQATGGAGNELAAILAATQARLGDAPASPARMSSGGELIFPGERTLSFASSVRSGGTTRSYASSARSSGSVRDRAAAIAKRDDGVPIAPVAPAIPAVGKVVVKGDYVGVRRGGEGGSAAASTLPHALSRDKVDPNEPSSMKNWLRNKPPPRQTPWVPEDTAALTGAPLKGAASFAESTLAGSPVLEKSILEKTQDSTSSPQGSSSSSGPSIPEYDSVFEGMEEDRVAASANLSMPPLSSSPDEFHDELFPEGSGASGRGPSRATDPDFTWSSEMFSEGSGGAAFKHNGGGASSRDIEEGGWPDDAFPMDSQLQ